MSCGVEQDAAQRNMSAETDRRGTEGARFAMLRGKLTDVIRALDAGDRAGALASLLAALRALDGDGLA
jgi:hypothetical protein